MKKFTLLLFLIVGLYSCDKLLDAFDIEAPFSTTFSIDVTENDELLYMETREIDVSNNQDFADNKDLIDRFTVKEVWYTVQDYAGEPNIISNGTLKFMNGTNVIGDVVSQTNVNFSALLASGEEVTIPITQATKDQLAEVLKNEMKFSVVIEGTCTDKPMYVEIEMFVQISAKVQP